MQTTDSPTVQAALADHEKRRERLIELPPHRFEFGVYQAPLVLVGDEIQCARFGCVLVVGWSEGPLRWPQCHINGPRSLILFGDLERAVELESADAVAVAWGVSRLTVNRWRQALDVARCNAGTTQRHRDNVPLVISAASNRVGLERAHAPAARRKAEATKRERGTIPGKRLWTEEQIGWMGQLTDAAIAQRVGCHPRTVEKERNRRHIPRGAASQYTEGFEQIDTAKLRARLLELGLTQRQLADRYGCAHSVINNIHRGAKTRVTIATLKKLARALRCAPRDLRA